MGLIKRTEQSFEALYTRFVLLSLLMLVSLLAIVLHLVEASTLVWVTLLLFILIPYLIIAWKVKTSLSTPLNSLSASLEAIRHEDYTLRTKPKFTDGAIKSISDEVSLIADDLKARKLNYDRQAVLVFNLIEQLATPIAVFDPNGRLHHGNDALSVWCGIPWRQAKQRRAEQFGLRFNASGDQQPWEIADQYRAQHWQLRYSEFSLSGERYQLVVLTNVEQLIKSTEKDAWQKMTRVLSHEINNSMAPIKSLAASLLELLPETQDNPKVTSALEAIVNRSDSLMRFVERYASLKQVYDLDIKSFSFDALMEKVSALFARDIHYPSNGIQVESDPIMLEQVLINLIKNAAEASPKDSTIEVSAKKVNALITISIKDSGTGIANTDNIFVPFYTTKSDGKGIGLALCRNIVEQLHGRLTLKNRADGRGAEAVICLPLRY